MDIYIGSDHAGFKLKEAIKKKFLSKTYKNSKNYNLIDCGNRIFDKDDDYPIFTKKVVENALKHKTFGVIVCGSAQGVGIAANKINGARAAVVFSKESAITTREHNDSNILCLSGWNTTPQSAVTIIEAFIKTPFSNEERHKRRIKEIEQIEKENKGYVHSAINYVKHLFTK